jgi:multimeric flavodoxin WrbA
MHILALIGSKRKNGNTASLVKQCLLGFEGDERFTTEVLYLGDMDFEGCRGCEGCARTNRCVIKDDMQEACEKMREADALIAASPTYFYNMSGDMKRFIDRCYCFTSYNPDDRSVWVSEFEHSSPRKLAGFISICEQNDVRDMGYTAEAMSSAFESLGYRTIFSQKVLHCFKAGEVKKVPEAMDKAAEYGRKLKNNLLLLKETAGRA